MRQGTTPTHTFTLPAWIDATQASGIVVTYRQGETVIDKTPTVESASVLTLTLTQEETMRFEVGNVCIQVAMSSEGVPVMRSNIVNARVYAALGGAI